MLRVRWLGRLPYAEAWDLQRALQQGRREGRSGDDYLLLLEHPPVYTIGRNGDGSHLLVSQQRLAELGAELFEVDRGGDITFHGPGQLVGYPIIALGENPDVVGYLRRLEEVLITTLADFGVEAWAEPGLSGVWTAQGKLAAIGVKNTNGVTMHGFALNVATDLSFFANIHPCGLDRPVTSVQVLAQRRVTLEEMVDALIPRFASGFGYQAVEEQRAAFSRGSGNHFDVDRRLAAGAFSPQRAIPVAVNGLLPGEPPRPEWMRVKQSMGEGYRELKSLLGGLKLNTVCEEAGCPNIYECWSDRTATLMLLGDTCTRACGFCNVKTGRPGIVDEGEPVRAAQAVAVMGLKHAVLTSVNRDDLEDGGASIFARTVEEIRRRLPDCDIEVLIPDFKGDRQALSTVLGSHPRVLNHNTETVLRLQRDIRTAANYGRSLALLARARAIQPDAVIKSGLIVGMGEREDEVMGALYDLRAVGVDVVTIGQYLRPTAGHRPIHRYAQPDEFARYREAGVELGFTHVEAGPLVRSSYHARQAMGARV